MLSTTKRQPHMYTKKLKAGYGDEIIVDEIDICLKRHEITTLIGPNGCGKSTILKTITRILKSIEGTVILDGCAIQNIPTKELATRISVLSQHQKTPEDITVEELVAYGRIPWQKWYQSDTQEDQDIVKWAMQAAAIDHMRKRRIVSLSGGERQRAWIATALAQKTDFLFLDEPTTYLDIAHQIEIMELVKRLNKELKIGIVMVLHDIEQAMDVSDQVIVVKKGKKIAEGRPDDVITEEMIREVYHVNCQILRLNGFKNPIITYNSLIDRKERME